MKTDTLTSRLESIAPSQRREDSGRADVLPTMAALGRCATRAMAGYLTARGLVDYQIFVTSNSDLYDLDTYIRELDPEARWETVPLLNEQATPLLSGMAYGETWAELRREGCLWFPSHRIVVGRWNIVEDDYLRWQALILGAAPSAADFLRFRKALIECRRRRGQASWCIIQPPDWEPTLVARPQGDPWANLFVSQPLRSRVEKEIIGFFSENVAQMYRELAVPCRRGVLMHGPPGNGKTSIIRAIGAALPKIPATILRPGNEFGTDELITVFDRWRESAPSILVIEDLDWLLSRVNVSVFLNQLDGVETTSSGGLLLLATTNHPELLDPAINNRPGRFDVVLEIPPPNAEQRQAFFAQWLPVLDAESREKLVVIADGLTFAHLSEIIRASGLLALADGRTARNVDDILSTARRLAEENEIATRGFRIAQTFGLHHLKRKESPQL